MNADIDQSQDGGSLNVDQTQFAAEGFMAGVNDNEQGSSDPVDALNQLIARSRGVNIDSSNPPKDSGMEGVKREIQKTTVSPQNLPDSTGPAASSSDWDNLSTRKRPSTVHALVGGISGNHHLGSLQGERLC